MTLQELICEIEKKYNIYDEDTTKVYIGNSLYLLFLEYPNFYYKHDESLNGNAIIFDEEFGCLFTKEEYREIWKKDANICQYREELLKLLATFWYMIELKCKNIHSQHDELITDFQKRVRRVAEKTYANSNERSESIFEFWKSYKENNRLIEICEYLYEEDNLCGFPTVLDIGERDFWKLYYENKEIQTITLRMEKIIEIYSSFVCSICAKWNEEQSTYKRSDVELSELEVEFIRFWTSKVPYIKKETSKGKRKNYNENEDRIKELKKNWESGETKRIITCIKNEMWEELSVEDRVQIFVYILKLSEDLKTIKRYMRVRTKQELDCKISQIRYKLEYPYAYRIDKYLSKIVQVVENEKVAEEDEEYIEKNLRKIYEKIIAREDKKFNVEEEDFEKQIEDYLIFTREETENSGD